MSFINISVKKHKIEPGDVAAKNGPSESKAPLFNEGRHTFEWREVGHVGAGGDMRKTTYDRTDSGTVDNADGLDGSTLTQVRDHAPKGHNNDVHLDNLLTTCNKYTKESMNLLSVDVATLEDQNLAGTRDHAPLAHSNDYHNELFMTTCNKYTKALIGLLGIDAATLDSKTLGTGPDNIAYYDVNGRVADVAKVKGTTVDATDIGAGKLLAYDATTETLVYKTLAELVPALNTDGKLILTGSDQISTKTGDLGELWDKSTKLTTADLEAMEFNQPNKIPLLDASTHLTLNQVVGNVPGLSGTGKLILTQVGTKVANLADLWDKTTKLVTTDFDSSTFNVADGMVKLDTNAKVPYETVPEIGGAATFVVAASNSENKDKADYICTGTDDQGKIMEAIADLPANGGSVILLEGVYTVDADNDPVKVTSTDNITIKGQGKGTKLCLDTGISSNIIEVADASGITIKDLYVDGTTTAPSEGDDLKQCGVIFITVTDSKIRNIYSLSNKRHGINISNLSQRNTAINCICNDNGYDGVLIFNSTFNILWECILISNTVDGVEAYFGGNNTFIANTLESNGGFGIIIARAENNTLTGNTCNINDNDSIQLWIADCNTVTGNSCCGGGNVGIRCVDDARYNIIFGNTISNTKMGIYIPWGDKTVVSGNSCCNNTPWEGIYATSEGLTITGNTCSYNGASGIAIPVYGQNVLFGNSCYNNTEVGVAITINSSYNTIVGNATSRNTNIGIVAGGAYYDTIVGNTSQLNQRQGISLYNTSSNNTVSSNLSTGNSQEQNNWRDNIVIQENSDYNNIQRNTCRAGGEINTPKYGINIADSNCTENFVTNNDIYNDNYGTSSLNIAAGSGTVVTPGNRTA